MTITITWATRTINVPRTDMAIVQASPEIRQLDLDAFRLILRNIEDEEEGIAHPHTHNHETETVIEGAAYARKILFTNGYTVTFEDGQYAVKTVGANSNISEVMNVNQVSLRTSNSAGLISATELVDSIEQTRQDVETWGIISSG